MPYVTNADIEERLGTLAYVQLTDDTGSGAADLDKVNEARLGAEGEVDSYLAARYAVPVDLVAHPELSAVLRTFVLDLVEYRLRNRRPGRRVAGACRFLRPPGRRTLRARRPQILRRRGAEGIPCRD